MTMLQAVSLMKRWRQLSPLATQVLGNYTYQV